MMQAKTAAPVHAVPAPPPIDRLAPQTRPSEPVIGYQRWQSALFLHWGLPADVVQRHLPQKFTADVFEGQAWISAVLFTVTNARLRPLPSLPGLSAFHQVTLRTYVHRGGKEPGVWFFSLDASNFLACSLGRLSLQLPYFPARMKRSQVREEHRFESRRYDVRKAKRARMNTAWKSSGALLEAPSGSLEHFLTQRFLLYSAAPAGRLWKQQVSHAPWPLQPTELLELEQTIDEAHELPFLSKRPLAHWSPGVDAEFFVPHLL